MEIYRTYSWSYEVRKLVPYVEMPFLGIWIVDISCFENVHPDASFYTLGEAVPGLTLESDPRFLNFVWAPTSKTRPFTYNLYKTRCDLVFPSLASVSWLPFFICQIGVANITKDQILIHVWCMRVMGTRGGHEFRHTIFAEYMTTWLCKSCLWGIAQHLFAWRANPLIDLRTRILFFRECDRYQRVQRIMMRLISRRRWTDGWLLCLLLNHMKGIVLVWRGGYWRNPERWQCRLRSL